MRSRLPLSSTNGRRSESDRTRQHPPASLTFLFTAALALLATACQPAPALVQVDFAVSPTVAGVDVEMLVQGGPTPTAWVGFGVGPGVSDRFVERVSDVRAVTEDGKPLELEPHGIGGWIVRLQGGTSWRLHYSLDLQPDASDGAFYRSSVRGDDYLVLVGSDAWPRLYSDPRPLAFEPGNRAPGIANSARVTLFPQSADWSLLGPGEETASDLLLLRQHPAGSVVVAGRFGPTVRAPGLELRQHADWSVLSSTVGEMVSEISGALHDRLGPPDEQPALAVTLPLPEPLGRPRGLRTAGMVRGRTVLLYGDSAAADDAPEIRDALAVFMGHELFHLYVPSAIQVTRDLSWLSEGWAMRMGRQAAVDAGFVAPATARRQLERTYRRYLERGGYEAGSLPAASMGSESERDLLYLRGELVFRLLDREWRGRGGEENGFGESLWLELRAAYDGRPLDAEVVHAILSRMVGPDVVRRYVVGTAPLTHGSLGLRR